MKNKRYLAMLLAATMAVSMTACGGSGGEQEKAPAGSTAENEGGNRRCGRADIYAQAQWN